MSSVREQPGKPLPPGSARPVVVLLSRTLKLPDGTRRSIAGTLYLVALDFSPTHHGTQRRFPACPPTPVPRFPVHAPIPVPIVGRRGLDASVLASDPVGHRSIKPPAPGPIPYDPALPDRPSQRTGRARTGEGLPKVCPRSFDRILEGSREKGDPPLRMGTGGLRFSPPL